MNPCPKKCNQCYVCWLYYFNPRYSKIWNRTETDIPKNLENYGPESIIKQGKNKFDIKASSPIMSEINNTANSVPMIKRIRLAIRECPDREKLKDKPGCGCQHKCNITNLNVVYFDCWKCQIEKTRELA